MEPQNWKDYIIHSSDPIQPNINTKRRFNPKNLSPTIGELHCTPFERKQALREEEKARLKNEQSQKQAAFYNDKKVNQALEVFKKQLLSNQS